MAFNRIIRKRGNYKNKWGIAFKFLNPWLIKLLKENQLSGKNFESDDQFTQIVFHIADMERMHKMHNKFYYNPYNNNITKYEEIIEEGNKVDWNCAICKTSIKSEISNYKYENFVCNKCLKSHNSKNKTIDSRIVESSFNFHKKCRKLLLKEQKRFMKYIKFFRQGKVKKKLYM